MLLELLPSLSFWLFPFHTFSIWSAFQLCFRVFICIVSIAINEKLFKVESKDSKQSKSLRRFDTIRWVIFVFYGQKAVKVKVIWYCQKNYHTELLVSKKSRHFIFNQIKVLLMLKITKTSENLCLILTQKVCV
jgi:hypothetical protein